MKQLILGTIAIGLVPIVELHAQELTINEVKGRIFDARMLQQTFVNGLKFCNELDGKTFYFPPRDRVLSLDSYHRALDGLTRDQVYNPDRHRPWNAQDAAERWSEVQRQAAKDKANCQLVASLPELEKQLAEMEKNSQTTQNKN